MLLESVTGSCADVLFAAKRRVLGADRVRRMRLYCVGEAKTGTHSVAAMFSKTVRSQHEAQARELAQKIFARRAGRVSEEELIKWLHARDRELALEVDSSQLNFFILDILLREFPEARFVLTLRDCYSWCDSLMNHEVRFGGKMEPFWCQVGDLRCRPEVFRHAPEEQWLKKRGLYALEGYLSHWSDQNTQVLEKVPKERLLVVRTDQINQNALEIADFGGLPRRAVRLDRAHDFQNPSKQEILRQIDRDFLEAKVEKHCRALMAQFFPEIKSLDDVKL